MKHQPFEEWLLNDTLITPEQRRELDLHLRSCAYCAALVETGRALHAVKMASPAPGFTMRFQMSLAERKLADRRRRFWGAILFTIGGLALLLWLMGPSLAAFLASPATWIASFVEWGIFLITTLQAMMQAGSVLLRIIPGFLSPFAWMILISAFAGISLLWSVSIWRFTRVPRGV
jgi:anti-sigma factor RsiW